jgi:zinc protease
MTAVLSSARADTTTVRSFPNGMKWIHRPVTHNHILAFQLFIPGGSIHEPLEKAGLTQLMTAAMVKGTSHRSALVLAQEMESAGASFGVDAQADAMAVGGQVPVDKWAKTFDLFEDILLHPSFPEVEVDKERAALLNGIRTNDEHIFNVAEELFRTEMFGGHPYGRPDEGTEKSVSALTREDLIAWHKKQVAPRGAVLVTVGKVPLAAFTKRVETFARAWESVDSSNIQVLPISYPAAARVVEDNKTFEQSYLMVGYPAPAVNSPRYPVVKLLNALLGGGMSSPLFRVVREEGTLAYEVSSFFPSRREGSSFVVYAGMDPKNLALAEEKIHAVLRDFLARPPSAQDLEDAKNYIRGHFLMDHQTNGRLAWYLGWWEFLGKGYAYDTVYPDDISRITADEVNRTAQELLSRPSVTIRVKSKGPVRSVSQ